MVYVTTLAVPCTVEHRMVDDLEKDKLDRTWKDAVVA
jgi:hypothetical protein